MAVTGSGPDVILIPGLGASRGIWNGTVAAVPGYRYHLIQVAGFGGEPARGNASGKVAASAAREVAQYIAARRLARPALVGHSMGGTIAMMVAARHPALSGKVMVVDMVPAPAQIFGASAALVRPLAGFLRQEIAGTASLRRELKWAVGKFGSTDWLESRNDADVVARSLEELMVTDLTPELVRIRAALTVVYARPHPVALTGRGVDRLYRRAYAARPDTRFIPVDDSGHAIMADRPRAFQGALRAFLASRR